MLIKKTAHKLKKFFADINLLFQRISLMAKLILLFVVVLAIPLIVLGGYYANMVRNSQQSELIKNNIFFVRQVKFNIDKKAEVCQRAAEIVIRNKKFIEYIAVNDIANVDDEEIVAFRNDMLNSINNIKFSNLDIYEIRFFAHRIPFEIWPILYDESRIIKSNWYEEMGKDVTRSYWHVNNIYETYKTVNPQMYEVVSLYKEVRYPSSQHLGTLEVCMLTSDFFEEMYDKNLDKENSWIIDWSDYQPDLPKSEDPVVNAQIEKDAKSNYKSEKNAGSDNNNIDKNSLIKKEPD